MYLVNMSSSSSWAGIVNTWTLAVATGHGAIHCDFNFARSTMQHCTCVSQADPLVAFNPNEKTLKKSTERGDRDKLPLVHTSLQ